MSKSKLVTAAAFTAIVLTSPLDAHAQGGLRIDPKVIYQSRTLVTVVLDGTSDCQVGVLGTVQVTQSFGGGGTGQVNQVLVAGSREAAVDVTGSFLLGPAHVTASAVCFGPGTNPGTDERDATIVVR